MVGQFLYTQKHPYSYTTYVIGIYTGWYTIDVVVLVIIYRERKFFVYSAVFNTF